MLQRIRDKSSGPLAYAVVALISLVFGVWGIGSYFTDSPNPVVAQVGATEITKYELQRAYDQRYQRLQQLMGDNFDHDLVKPDQFRRDVLEGLIQQHMLTQYAQSSGYRVTDRALLNSLRADRRFQVDGSFSPERYRALLAQAGVSPAAFESGLRDDLQLAQVREGVLNTSFVTHREVGRAFRLDNQRREVAYLRFRADAYRDQVEVSDARIQAYYDENAQAFTTDEQVKLAYVDLDRNSLEIAEQPDDEFLRAIYEQEKDARFKTPERRKARHILVRIDQDTDADAARQRIQELAGKLDGGDEFSELARSHSDDEATAEKGGDLGWITRGTMVEDFEQALYELETGAISAPVRTDFGWHLIKLEDVDPAEVKAFDSPEVQAELLELYRAQEREERFRQASERLDALSFEAPDSLQPLADELDLSIKTSDWISRDDGEGLAQYEAVRQAAFSDSVLKDRLNSTPVQLSGDRMIVLRVAEHRRAERKPLEQVRAEIRAELRDRAAAELARENARQALSALRDGKTLATVASQTQAELQEPGWLKRDARDQDSKLLSSLFAMPRPQDEAPVYRVAELGSNAFGVLRLTRVEEVAPEAKDAVDREKLAQALRGRIAGLEYAALRRSLRDDFEIEIHEKLLN